jgi:hypothetical protein
MPKKRTRQQKKKTALRRVDQPIMAPVDTHSISDDPTREKPVVGLQAPVSQGSSGVDSSSSTPRVSGSRPTASIAFLRSQVHLIYADLLRTAVVSIIVIGLLVGIYFYLLYNG